MNPLDPRTVEQEIARMRERESSPYSSGIKTNLFTLLILRGEEAESPGPADPVEAAVQYLLGRRPARIITLARTRNPRTEAWVSGRCFPDKRNRGVCFEEVRILAGEDGLGEDPGAWGPLLIRDLPVFAWIAAGGPPDALLAASDLIDKVLVDSSHNGQGSVLAALQRFREKTGGAFVLSDFAWRRTRILREQSARAFDPLPMRPLLSAIRRARLYGASPSEAALFFSWLQVRLGRRIEVEHAAAGTLVEGFRVTFFIDGAGDLDIGCTRGGCLSRGEEKGAYRFPSDGEILLDEVDTLSRDAVFLEVLAHAGQPRA